MEPEREHWEAVYETKDPTAVSWYEESPEASIRMIEATGLPKNAAIVDVGGGASLLAASLAARGYADITVTDVSAAALDRARAGAGGHAPIAWVEADVRDAELGREFDLWHDRALFHFMVREEDRAAYAATLRRSVRPGGHAIIATFGPDGPTRCSGLPVDRYGTEGLEAELEGFTATSSELRTHLTPAGKPQQFLYAALRRDVS